MSTTRKGKPACLPHLPMTTDLTYWLVYFILAAACALAMAVA